MSRYVDPVPQYFLNNGDVASDGLLYFYENLDYLTPKATYNLAGVLNPNPVPLDGSGRVPEIAGSGLYSVVFKSSIATGNVLQWQRDEVSIDASLPGLGNTIVGDLTFSADNSAIKSNAVDVIEFTSGTGIPKFPIGSKLSNSTISDSLVMDWHEEGSSTPTIIGTSTAGSATYTTRTCFWTRENNRVSGAINLVWSGHTGTGSMRITGLPFTCARESACSVFFVDFIVGSGKQLCCLVRQGQTYLDLYACDIGGGPNSNVNIDAAGSLTINFDYEV